uniref:Mating type protein A-alpha Y6 n=1 Tax=Schizophyllum commune TaxID=5334 RepID=Q9P448_SCHCO|nr:mating type protein A-alpha Y6 [Schizophyllum commune]
MEDLVPHLKNILANARGMAAYAASRGGYSIPPQYPASAMSLEPLPSPNLDYLRSRLQHAKLPARSVAAALSAYERACTRWRRELEDAFSKTAVYILPSNLHLFNALRIRLYTQQVEKWHAQVLEVPAKWTAEMEKQRAHIAATMGPAKGSKPRPKFHSEYTPLLELYFRFNAYPTYADRRILAEKTGMLTRQITVWFQNHRRRANAPLPRMAPTEKIPMEEFERERERMARKLLPVLVPPHMKPLTRGNENDIITPRQAAMGLKGMQSDSALKTQKAAKQSSKKTPRAGPSTILGALVVGDQPAVPERKKKSKTSKGPAHLAPSADVVMVDATSKKEKKRKIKKLPRVVGQAPAGLPMDVDTQDDKASRKAAKKAKKEKKVASKAFDSAGELAFARAAYPTPSKYAYVHTRKPHPTPSDTSARPYGQLGKGRPTPAPTATTSTVPPHRVSSRLNAMRPPYAFPARYNPATVPLTFATAQTHQFSFATDSASFGFKERLVTQSPTRSVYRAVMDNLVSHFDRLRLLGDSEFATSSSVMVFEHEVLRGLRAEGLTAVEASVLRSNPDSYAARRAITYVPPKAPLESIVTDLPRALRQQLIRPMVLPQPVVQPDAFAPFIALAERRARRKERKEKKRLEEKLAKRERKKAGLPKQSPSSSMAVDSLSRVSSVVSDPSSSSRKLSKKARKSSKSASDSSRAASVASSGRTPSLSSVSSRRSSGMSMPGTPGPEQNLPIMSTADFNLPGDEDVTMTSDLMTELFGEDASDTAVLGQTVHDEITPDMLTFSSTDSGALSDMTADVNMPDLGSVYAGQQSIDDMSWAASLGLGAQDSAPLGSFEQESNVGLDWLLSHNLLGGTQMSDYTCPTSTPSQINILGGTYTCELGGSDNTSAPFDMNDWTFGLGACDDGFAGFGNNLLGGTAVAA